MPLIKQDWTGKNADEWTLTDLFACLFGVAAYVLVTVGVAGSLLLRPWGFITLAGAALFTWLTFAVINPKLRALSDAFSEKQEAYLAEVEKKNRWEVEDGD